MSVIIKKEPENTGRTIAIIVTVTLTIIVLALVVWYYVLIPYGRIRSFSSTTTIPCTTPPSPPSGFSGSASENSAVLSWNRQSSTNSYRVYVGVAPGFNRSGSIRVVPTINNTVNVINLIPGTYYFMVSALNTCGESSTSPQISVIITVWPTTIKLCKSENPTLCLFLAKASGQNARVSVTCPANGCNISYESQNKLATSPDNTYCLNNNFILNPNIENDVSVQVCNGSVQQIWTVDLNTRRVVNPQGLCLGSTLTPESFVFNTDCSSIVATDSRYLWVPQAI